ncbi:MAG: RdgB/HAM1 family non-canonical purine NTP pyrophosphatase [Candidatus Protistobacter heckmanni]|nr:RdgB/HAM1 family non-canonical purine NTP pyrophosphatase [Candidatus Protistobacter heckmanni]
MSQLVLASNNAGKLIELSALLAPLSVELVPQGKLGIPSAEEPYPSFLENALTKARHAARASGLPALADDSGICVDALSGAPGIYSARYAEMAGAGKGDDNNNRYLVSQLQGETNRRASYACMIVAVRHAEAPLPLIAEGRWEGEVVDEPRGAGGFGYDPYFLIPALGKTVAELSKEEKAALSHRGQAVRLLLDRLPDWLSR